MSFEVSFALAITALAVVVIIGLMRRNVSHRGQTGGAAGGAATGGAANTVAQHAVGDTTRLLLNAGLPGLYSLRPRFLSKADYLVYLLLKVAFPRDDVFARIRLADVLQVKVGPQGMERLQAFRKVANQQVGFVVCGRDMAIVAIIDSKDSAPVHSPRDQKLELIKQRCMQAAQVKYICVYPPTLPRYRELREQILGSAAELV